MPRYSISAALLEKADDDAVMCRSCKGAAIGEGPYCRSCKDYWENDAALIQDEWERDFWADALSPTPPKGGDDAE